MTDNVNKLKGDLGLDWKPLLSNYILLFHIRLNIKNNKLILL